MTAPLTPGPASGGVGPGDTADGVTTGWHHTTRSVGAHYFADGWVLCQESDPGTVADDPDGLIGVLCSDCRAVYRSRVLHAFRMARLAFSPGSGDVA